MKGYAPGLPLKKRHKATRKWPMQVWLGAIYQFATIYYLLWDNETVTNDLKGKGKGFLHREFLHV